MKRTALISFLITLAIWLVYAWPLPRHLASSIPSGYTRAQLREVTHTMEPGDHLQLLYHFWLFSDFVRGGTPWFHNVYEFNTGNDADRYEPGTYYFPFSLFYTVGQWIRGPAMGWNLSGFIALWLTYLFTWRLARRYAPSEGWAALCALVAIIFPYRWINIAGGSPTGFSMMWVPALLYGLDRAVRDRDIRGGLWAGFALLMASWGDTHTFYFTALATPCWCIIAWIMSPSFTWKTAHREALALLPVPLFGGLAFLSSKLMTKGIASSHASGGRAISEIALFSPHAEGFVTWADRGGSNHIYLGHAMLLFLALAIVVHLITLRRHRRDTAVFALLILGLVGICMLSLGPFSPFDGRPFTAARKFIPQYTMIRQPAKIFCLLPTIIAIITALTASAVRGRARFLLVALPILASAGEYKLKFMPVLCPLDPGQPAYQAAADHSAGDPRALVLPLWPGDSHYTSVYQYYALLYRIRLVNGYRPFVPQSYIDDVARPLESANLGVLTDAQLQQLTNMGVTHILLHEDLFPEKVSPFPIGYTLQNLLNHPRLTLEKHAGTVWAFKIEEEPRSKPPVDILGGYYFAARQFNAARLKHADDKWTVRAFSVPPAPELRWLIHGAGPGSLIAGTFIRDEPASTITLNFASAAPEWAQAPIPVLDSAAAQIYPMLKSADVTVDYLLLAAGKWPALRAGEKIRIPATAFFHEGYTDLAERRVALTASRDPRAIAFYGPKLPVPAGRYRATVAFDSPAPRGTSLGAWLAAAPEGREVARAPALAGEPLQLEFEMKESWPLLLAFDFTGVADISFERVDLERIE